MGELYHPEASKALPKKTVRECSGHILTITEAEPLPFAVANFDLSRFGAKEEMARFFLKEVALWIQTPAIEDDFQDHEARIAWRKTLSPDDLALITQENKISGTRLGAAIGALQSLLKLLIDTCSPLTLQFMRYNKLLQEMVKELNREVSPDPAQYLETTQEVDAIARKTLAVLA